MIKNPFNLGHDDSWILSNLIILDILEKNNKLPNKILLHTDPGLYFRPYSSYFYSVSDIDMFSVFYNESDIIKEYLKLDKVKWILHETFKTYPFNGKLLSIIKNFIKTTFSGNYNNAGYDPIPYSKYQEDKFIHFLTKNSKNKKHDYCYKDQFAISALEKFINICKKNNIELICFNAPEYLGDFFFVSNLEDLLKKEKTHFVDYSKINKTFTQFKNTKYWKDNDHLNDLGANIFTSILINDLLN